MWVALLVVISAAARAADRHPALAPVEALKSFRLEDGLRIELVAAEPLVVDPVAFAFEPDGRLYVVEDRAYPDPVKGDGGASTLGRIALLEDSDRDGRYDRRTEFATGLGYVNGILLWRGGMFITAAPDILYLKDTDGDGVADVRRVVLTGFDATKSSQLRVSHPTLGFDGNVYVTSGLNGGKVRSPAHPERPAVEFSARDGRFDPETFQFENTGGRAQYGLSFDPFGRRFITTNRHPVLQVMIEPWHLTRNPHLAFSENTQEVSKTEAGAAVFPISSATIAADFIPQLMAAPHTGTFTSACGTLVFGGTALAPGHTGDVFVCEPAQNLVQRQKFRAAGASFRSDPVEQGRDFLASTDVWFRPVFLGHGPDGALYIADMYRREIDHPRYIPAESRGLLDFESGKDRGRIYRIVRAGLETEPRPPPVALAGAAGDGPGPKADIIVGQLESAEEWWRAWAQRLLIERAERGAIPAIEAIAIRSNRAESRARALWTLRGLRGLTPAILATAMRDPHGGVREQAVQLAGEIAGRAPELRREIATLARDDDARVRFCTALVLGSMDDVAAVPALAAIAARDGEDRWTRAAVLSGIGSRMDGFLAELQKRRTENPGAFAAMMEDLGRVFGAGAAPEACRSFLKQMLTGEGDLSWRLSSVLGLVEGFRARMAAQADAIQDPFIALMGTGGRKDGALQVFLIAAAKRATDERIPTSERVSAISLLAQTDFEFAGATLGGLLDARQPPEVQLQVVRALERLGDPRGGALLIARENWTHYTPQVREAVMAMLTSRSSLIAVLFKAIKSGVVAAPEVSSIRRARLLKHKDASVRNTAAAIFKDLEAGDRMQVYRQLRESLSLPPDLARGRDVFIRACSACHTYNGTGGKVGPDLTGIRNQPAEAILLHILVPNYEVAPSYQTMTVATQDGRAFTGWLSAESESSIALRTAAGTEETVLRRDIASLTASGVSLMPDGLEQTMEKNDVASLVAYLKSG